MKTKKALFYLPEHGNKVCLATLAQFLTGLSNEGYEIHASVPVVEIMSTLGNTTAQTILPEEKAFSDYDVCVLDCQDLEAEKLLKILSSATLVIDCNMIECDEFYLMIMEFLSLDQDSVVKGTDKKVSEYCHGFIDAQRNLVERIVDYYPPMKAIEQEIDRCVGHTKVNAEVFYSEPYKAHLLEVGKSGSSPYLSDLYEEVNSKTYGE